MIKNSTDSPLGPAAVLRQTRAARNRRRWVPWALLLPGGLLLGVMLAVILLMVRISFGEKNAEFETWTLANYFALTEKFYWRSLLLTLKLAFLSAVFAVLLGFPVALFLARVRNQHIRRVIFFALLLPLMMNLLLQSFGWIVILSPTGLLSQFVQSVGLTSRPFFLMFTETGVLMALVQTSLPIAVLPMAGSLQTIPRSLEEAAATLGAGRLHVYWHVIGPLCLPGILAATLLVFAFNASAFAVPLILGGEMVSMTSLVIRDLMGPVLNWPFGAANAVVLMILTIVVLSGYQRLMARLV